MSPGGRPRGTCRDLGSRSKRERSGVSSDRRCWPALLDRHPDLQRPDRSWRPAWRASAATCPPTGRWTIEVIVVDDASTDDTADVARVALPRGPAGDRLERNGGFCAAANAGIAAARGQFIQLLNNDTEVTAGWIEAGLAPFADPTVGSVAPLVLVRSDPDRVDSAGDSYTLAGWPTKRGPRPAGRAAGSAAASRMSSPPAAPARSYRAEAIRQVGGFDPLLGLVLRGRGPGLPAALGRLSLRLQPRCRILHEISATYDHAQPDAPAADGPQRRARLLVEHARRPAGGRPRASCLAASWRKRAGAWHGSGSSPSSWARSTPSAARGDPPSAAAPGRPGQQVDRPRSLPDRRRLDPRRPRPPSAPCARSPRPASLPEHPAHRAASPPGRSASRCHHRAEPMIRPPGSELRRLGVGPGHLVTVKFLYTVSPQSSEAV